MQVSFAFSTNENWISLFYRDGNDLQMGIFLVNINTYYVCEFSRVLVGLEV